MKTKLELAHEWFITAVNNGLEATVDKAWQYADAMQAEADKSVVKGVPEAISSVGTTDVSDWQPSDLKYMNIVLNNITNECKHEWDHVSAYGGSGDYYVCPCGAEKHPTIGTAEDWKPDWSQAPEKATWWAMDADNSANFFKQKPEITNGNGWDFGGVMQSDRNHNYPYNWQNSLRKRPEGK